MKWSAHCRRIQPVGVGDDDLDCKGETVALFVSWCVMSMEHKGQIVTVWGKKALWSFLLRCDSRVRPRQAILRFCARHTSASFSPTAATALEIPESPARGLLRFVHAPLTRPPRKRSRTETRIPIRPVIGRRTHPLAVPPHTFFLCVLFFSLSPAVRAV